MLETSSTKAKEVEIALIRSLKKGGKKGVLMKGKEDESNSENQGKKDLSHVKCLMCRKKKDFILANVQRIRNGKLSRNKNRF